MKQILVLAVMAVFVIILSNCHASKKAAAASAHKLNYEANIKTLITDKCSPCHIPARGGNKKAFDTYEAAKENIDSMVSRIERSPGEKGFMPFKKSKLSDSAIAVFKQWRAEASMGK